ncbi:hypothetical protein ASPTUDRAFT_61513 [Aspergillus tubingensis CBS 134.48]|uniref:Uncharacterized protein n=1 Tax=Aspergillus tubingensis (strain CBS 134.48) TaxID=767770 RepID=A0A1L9NFV5_ASPTC|nr:hypothetical protein ASPTUDRAFT_61513 [Aspergillus tubingensis CBS 134.48]
MMMRRIGKVEKNSIWRGKDGLLEAREPAGETVRPSVCRRCMLAAAGCLTGRIEHDDLALRDMAVIVVQRQVVSFGNGTTRAIAQSSGEAGLTRPPPIQEPVIGISSAAPLSLVKGCQLWLHPLAAMPTTSIPSYISRNRDLAWGGVVPSSLTDMFATFHDEEPHILLPDIS